MSQSDLYDFFSYVARDGKSTTDTATSPPAMARRTSIISSTSSSDSDSSAAPTPMSTTTTTRAPLMPNAASRPSSSPPSAAATRLTADEITARILASPEHHALCEMISGRHDHDDDYARRSADKYRAFVDLAARLEAQKMPTAPKSRKTTAASAAFDAAMMQHQQHEQARRECNSLWW
ncbi:hypothetical protein PG993_004736 [Apiospora rasikravindrae]|uniref:Uncharacterized protein n=1 Tax=Apiospora rasikravindrae TaxID=990691 RepID=A0ABR1TDP3_9PEZI